MSTQQKRKKQVAVLLEQFYSNPVAKVSMELFLTVGLVVFLALFAIKPTLLTMSDLLKEIEDKQELDGQLSKKVAALGSAQSIYLDLEDRLEVLDAAIPSDPQTIKTLKMIEKIATDNSVVLGSVSLDEVPESTSVEGDNFDSLTRQSFTISVTAIGSYNSIKNFVSDLQNSQRTFVVDSVIFRISDSRGDKQLRASLSLQAPYFATKGAAANAQ